MFFQGVFVKDLVDGGVSDAVQGVVYGKELVGEFGLEELALRGVGEGEGGDEESHLSLVV